MFSCIQGTIRPNPNLNAELAARQLNGAFQGIKSDAVTIINILTNHSNHQRQKIKRHYRILYVKVSTWTAWLRPMRVYISRSGARNYFYLGPEGVTRSDRHPIPPAGLTGQTPSSFHIQTIHFPPFFSLDLIEAEYSSETLTQNQNTIWRNNPEHHGYSDRHENFKSYRLNPFSSSPECYTSCPSQGSCFN